MEDRWTTWKMDGLDFVEGPDPWGLTLWWGGQNGPKVRTSGENLQPIFDDLGVDL